MLKKAMLGVLFLPALAIAQEQGPVRVDKPVLCAPTEQVFDAIAAEYGETPIWSSQKEDSRIMLTVNVERQTWSIVQFNDEWACLIEAGQGYHFEIKGT
jgi:hypothetical protein